MKVQLLISVMLVFVCSSLFFAQATDTTVDLPQLKSTPFTAGALKITFTSFKRRIVVFNGSKSIGDRVSILVEAENTSDSFATFDPQRLSIVNENYIQADILGVIYESQIFNAESRSIAPKARIKAQYVLNDKVELPARIYYEGKLLATIKE